MAEIFQMADGSHACRRETRLVVEVILRWMGNDVDHLSRYRFDSQKIRKRGAEKNCWIGEREIVDRRTKRVDTRRSEHGDWFRLYCLSFFLRLSVRVPGYSVSTVSLARMLSLASNNDAVAGLGRVGRRLDSCTTE